MQSPDQGHLGSLRQEIEVRLEQLLPAPTLHPENLHQAMSFGMLAPGKRVRPLLALLIAEAAGQGRAFALDAGCAVECVHTASLILDDLPCMDDAELRRGQPTTHRKFGEATAILSAIGLLNRAFSIIADSPSANPALRAKAMSVLTQAIGSEGMIAGQEIDISRKADFQGARHGEKLNWLKTGVLFVSTARIGGIAAGLDEKAVGAMETFAKCVGLAFQTADDLIDQTGNSAVLGKDIHQDIGKPNLVSIAGKEAAQRACEAYLEEADQALISSGLDTSGLRALVDTIFGSKI